MKSPAYTLVLLFCGNVFSDSNNCSDIAGNEHVLQKRFHIKCSLVEELEDDVSRSEGECKELLVIEKQFRVECKLVEEVSHESQQCLEGWVKYRESCYLFSNSSSKINMHFPEAAALCATYGAHMVFVETEDENNFLNQKLELLTFSEYWWIGLTDKEEEGIWKWYGTDKTVSFTDWEFGQPDDFEEMEDCVLFRKRLNNMYKWNDGPCNSAYASAICERKMT